MRKHPAALLSTAVLMVAASGCGGSSSSSTSSPGPVSSSSTASTASTTTPAGALSIAADPNGALKFTKTSLTANAGKVTIQFTNSAALAHNLTIQRGSSGSILGATPTFEGGTKMLTLNLKPGTYTFFCSVPGHRQGGMQGTLIVK